MPTAKEAGIPAVHVVWNGMLSPAGTPKEALDWLHREMVKAVASPEVSGRLSGLGYEPGTVSRAEFTKMIASDYERFGKVIREAGIKVE